MDYALKLDEEDPLKTFREHFHIPERDENSTIYFCGNSLGLQPKQTPDFIEEELRVWRKYGVEGHFNAIKPWSTYHKIFKTPLAKLVGASPYEVVAMNTLTVNLHLLLVSFYRPTPKKYKILMEAGAFPSDQYAIESQVKYHGFDPEEAIIEVTPREGEYTLRSEDILAKIEEHRESLALVLFSGVQYYTGQFFNIKEITHAAHEAGAIAGFDLAHAIGNVPMKLQEWKVDFAVWCSYKYLNSGPGAIAGAFIHKNHGENLEIPRFAGWWGHHEEERFLMNKGFKPIKGADGWQLSNPDIISMASLRASLSLFDSANIDAIRTKSLLLTGFLEFLINDISKGFKNNISIISPSNNNERGCQLSLFFNEGGVDIFNKLHEEGVIVDWREPNVIRVAPTPLYNTFSEVFQFANILENALTSLEN